jgi:hypothetical protein
MIRFPSEQFFLSLKHAADRDPDRYRRLGTIDLVLVAKIDYEVGSECFEITFSGYRVTGVRRIARPADAAPGAVVLEGPAQVWREMIESVERNGKADLGHTLNTLTIADFPMRVTAENQLDVDAFYRFQETLQEFFDEAATFRTEFATRESAGAAAPA